MPKIDDRISDLETQLKQLKAQQRAATAPKQKKLPVGRPLEDSSFPLLDRAVRKFGKQYQLAQKLGISNQRFQNWRKRGRVPAEWVLALEKASGISRHDIRPDLYPPGI